MKYVVKVADQSYQVEIDDIRTRPVIARVDGQEFKVNPENGVNQRTSLNDTKAITQETRDVKSSVPTKSGSDSAINISDELNAPLPGTVIEVFMKAGDHIEAGQVVLIIEAMKMKNSIRSTRAGEITEVLVQAGQTVAHKQPLVRFG